VQANAYLARFEALNANMIAQIVNLPGGGGDCAVMATGVGAGALAHPPLAADPGYLARTKMFPMGNRISSLTHLKLRDARAQPVTVINEIGVGSAQNKLRLIAIGKLRFDTYFIRKLFFITNIARILRLKLNRELTQDRNVLPTSHMSVTPGITEYDLDPFAPNETYATHIGEGFEYRLGTGLANEDARERRGMTRFNDEVPGI
jgi:hypothetical protein